MDSSADTEEMSSYSAELLQAVLRALPTWMMSRISAIAPNVNIDVETVLQKTQVFVSDKLSSLFTTDVDSQRENPLHILRQSTMFATQALQEAGVPLVARDDFERQSMPDDVYAFGPLTWRDLSEEVHELGITWGAWKAATVLTRRRAEGKLP